MDTHARRSTWAGPGLLFAAWCSLFAAAEPAPATSTPAVDPLVEAYGALPAITDLQVSPDGRRIAAMRPLAGVMGVTVIDLETRTQNVVLAADPARFQVGFCRWASDTRLICQTRVTATLPYGERPKRFLSTALVAVNHDGSQRIELMKDDRPTAGDRLSRGNFVSLLPNDPDHILMLSLDKELMESWDISAFFRTARAYPDIWRVNIHDDRRTRVVRFRDGIGRWFADDNGTVQGGVGRDDFAARAVIRDGDNWRPLDISAFGDELDANVLFVDNDGKRVWFAARAAGNQRAVHEMDTTTGTTRIVWSDPRFDFAGDAYSRAGQVLGLVTVDDRLRMIPLSDEWKALDAELRAALPNETLVPWSQDATGQRLTLRSATPFQPTVWYFYDRTARKLTRIGPEYPRVRDADAPVSRWVTYKARDGLEIPALLTLPRADARGLPTILFPHGGPVARTGPDFDFTAAFLARRGYAVLQPQFRGSFGYGRQFLAAGFRNWGLAMQDDVMDGLAWLRTEGIADARNACIVGMSYGGYSALVAAYKTPELIRCAVSYAGVSDLPMLVRNRALYGMDERSMNYLQLSLERDLQEANSPINNVERIRTPLLLMHADLDVNVLVEQSRDFVDALKAAGKPHRYIEQQNGDHFFGVQAHRTQWLQELDAFLAEHLRPPAPGAG